MTGFPVNDKFPPNECILTTLIMFLFPINKFATILTKHVTITKSYILFASVFRLSVKIKTYIFVLESTTITYHPSKIKKS